jgi:hypothetical protein
MITATSSLRDRERGIADPRLHYADALVGEVALHLVRPSSIDNALSVMA